MQLDELLVGVFVGSFMVLGSIAYIEAAAPSLPTTVSACENRRGAYVIRTHDQPLCVLGKRAFFVKDR